MFVSLPIEAPKLPTVAIQLAAKFMGLDELSKQHQAAIESQSLTMKQKKMLIEDLKKRQVGRVVFDPSYTSSDPSGLFPFEYGTPLTADGKEF